MKKLAYIIIFSALVCGCTSKMEYSIGDVPEALMLNASFSSEETHHVVYLGLSRANVLEEISGGSVQCYRNGELIASVSQRDSVNSYLQSIYSFDAIFEPGDEVKLVANADGYSVSSSATFPAKPYMEVSKYMIQPLDLVIMKTRMQFYIYNLNVDITDPSEDERYYALELFYDYEADSLYAGDTVNFEKGRVLCQGLYMDNHLFEEDGTLSTPYIANADNFTYPGKVEADTIYVHGKVTLELAAIPAEYYYFLQTTGVIASNGSTATELKDIIAGNLGSSIGDLGDMAFSTMTELPLSSNVEGGYGFFGVRSVHSIVTERIDDGSGEDPTIYTRTIYKEDTKESEEDQG